MKQGHIIGFEIGLFSFVFLSTQSNPLTSFLKISANLSLAHLWHCQCCNSSPQREHSRRKLIMELLLRLNSPLKTSTNISLPPGSLPRLHFPKNWILLWSPCYYIDSYLLLLLVLKLHCFYLRPWTLNHQLYWIMSIKKKKLRAWSPSFRLRTRQPRFWCPLSTSV